jgi:hypothetical protein
MESQPVVPVRAPELGVIELLGYLGMTLALAGTVAVAAATTEPTQGVMAATALVIAVAFLAIGQLLGADPADRLVRMRSVVWFVSVEAFAVFLAVSIEPGDRTGIFVVELLVAVYAFALWAFLPRLLQQFVFYTAALGAILALVFPEPTSFFFGPPNLVGPALVLWLGGAAWFGLGAMGRVRPPRTAMVLGVLASVSGPFLLFDQPKVATILVTSTAAVYLFAGGRLGDRAVSGVAIVGVIVGTVGFLKEVGIDDTGPATITLVTGVAALAVAILMARIGRPGGGFGRATLPIGPRIERPTPPAPMEIPPPPGD